jgi:preprotein translocase subunit SecG
VRARGSGYILDKILVLLMVMFLVCGMQVGSMP